jgi:phage tail-like protein
MVSIPSVADDLLHGYNFVVSVGVGMIGFRSVSGLKITAAFEPLAVGGYNSSPVMLPASVKEPGRLTFERGKRITSRLIQLKAGSVLPEPMTIMVLNPYGVIGASYSVTAPVMESVELSKLGAEDSAVLIETFTVIHRGVEEL